MTDQKQAPEEIWVDTFSEKQRGPNWPKKPVWAATEYVRKDLHDAAIKQRDELAASEHGLLGRLETCKQDVEKAEAERDQALASVGAVIEKAMDAANEADSLELALHGSVKIVMRIHAINPDATAALNEMLAEAWVEGMWVGLGEDSPPINDNPYRTQPSRSSDAGKSEDRG